MAKTLTKRQREILDFIIMFSKKNGMPPTISEIGRRFHIASTNAVSDHLRALERKGFIQRSSKARSIRLTDKVSAGLYTTQVGVVPLVGRIAAGSPVLAEENIETYVPVAASAAREGVFGLRVQGDSMIEAGILAGDIIIVDPDVSPNQGDIVVALVDDEATVKRYYRHGDLVELRPANPAFKSLFFPADVLQVQGVVIALQRSIR